MFYFTQINLHKAKLAAIELHNQLQQRNDIALITEPYIVYDKVVGLPTGYQAIFVQPPRSEGAGQDNRPSWHSARAAILIPKQFQAVQLDHLS